MADIAHQWGFDLKLGPTGDLAVATGSILCQQRVLRRLLTNLLDYIWHPSYGAGLAGFIGRPANTSQIRAAILGAKYSRKPQWPRVQSRRSM